MLCKRQIKFGAFISAASKSETDGSGQEKTDPDSRAPATLARSCKVSLSVSAFSVFDALCSRNVYFAL
jgi:hypothetical protein